MSLRIDHISKYFGDTAALKEVSIEIKDGEFIAILGPSGCGKTTLLRVVGGFINPTEGSIQLEDKLYSSKDYNVSVENRDLGMVFQSFALWPHMTIREHIEFPLKSKKNKNMTVQERKQTVNKAVAIMGLTELEGRLPGELSGGQRQRVALARAVVSKPRILLMDEPLSALDAELKINMRREIQDIHKMTRATILYVTHDQSEALAMADRIIIMKNGQVEQIGTPEEIYRRPKTKFVATFVCKSNIIHGKWAKGKFYPDGTHIMYDGIGVNDCFAEEGIYPVRPEEFKLSKQGEGIKGIIVNKQYNGREIHYTVKCNENYYTVYENEDCTSNVEEEIILVKKERNCKSND